MSCKYGEFWWTAALFLQAGCLLGPLNPRWIQKRVGRAPPPSGHTGLLSHYLFFVFQANSVTDVQWWMQTVGLKIGLGVGVDAFFSNVGLRPAGLTQDDLSARHVLFYCWAQQKQEKKVFLTVIDRWSVVLVCVKWSLLRINVMTSCFHKHMEKTNKMSSSGC